MRFLRSQMRVLGILLIALMVAAASTSCSGQQSKFPSKPMELIITWPAGSASDIAGRTIAKYAEKELGQPITPLNIDGANGATGWAEAAKAKPDGYTIAMITFDILTNQATGRSPVKYTDFEYLLQFTAQPMGIIVKGDSPYKTLDDLLNAAKANPETIKVGTTPLGGVFHQVVALLEKSSGAKFRVIPFQGTAEINAAGLGGHVDAQINTLALAYQYVKDGSLRVLAVTSEKRSPAYPDVPTLKELGHDIVMESFRAMAVPKGTPADVKKTLTDAFTKAYNAKEYQETATKAKQDIYYRNAEDFLKFLDDLYPKVNAVIQEVGLKK